MRKPGERQAARDVSEAAVTLKSRANSEGLDGT